MRTRRRCLLVNALFFITIVNVVFITSIPSFGYTTQKEESENKSFFEWLQETWDTFFTSDHLTYGPFELNGNRYIYKGDPIYGDYELDGPLRIDADMELNSHISAKDIEINAEVTVGYSQSTNYPFIKYGKLESIGDIRINRKGSLALKKGTNIVCNKNFISKSEKEISISNGTITINKNFDLRNKWETSGECIIKIKGPEKHILKGDETVSIGNLIFTEDSLLSSVVKKKFFQELFSIERWGIQFYDTMRPSRTPELNEYMQMTVASSNVPAEIIAYAQIYIYKLLICDNDFGIDIMNTFFKVKTDPESAAYIDLHSAKGEKGIYLDAKKNIHVVTLDVSYIGTRNGKKGTPFGFASLNIQDEGTYAFYFTPNPKYIDSTVDDFVGLIRQGASEAIKDQVKDIAIGQIITDIADLSSTEVFDFEPGIALCNNVKVYEFLKKYGDHVQDWNRVNKGLKYDASSKTKIQAKEEHTEGANEISSEDHSDDIQARTDDKSKQISPFIETINDLISQYGSLRIVQNNNDWENEANGLCYLNLIDFTGDGEDELMAVCKNEDEEHYTGYIFTIKDGSVELLYENPEIEYTFFQGFDLVNLGYTPDTGYVFGTGWEDADADDRTFFWYKDGEFKPVYRYNGFWDGELEDEVINEKVIVVDIFDDAHRDEFYNSFPRITLRTMSDINVDGDSFSVNDLQRNIDLVIQKLGGDGKTLKEILEEAKSVASTNESSESEKLLYEESYIRNMDSIADSVIYHCFEADVNKWEPDLDNKEYFWDVLFFYCNNEYETFTFPEGEGFFIVPDNVLINAAYACFKTFNGALPTIDTSIWRVHYNDSESKQVVWGDSGVATELCSYVVNKDMSVDAVYALIFWVDEDVPSRYYKVHYIPNAHNNDTDLDIKYHFTVDSVERIEDYPGATTTMEELSQAKLFK